MDVIDKQTKIMKKLTENGWTVLSCSFAGRCEVVAKKRWEEISITTEECTCHGGRMWINGNHSTNHFEISHPEYDESLGIVDSSTELDWIIENEMMEYVNKLSTFVYKLIKINEYGKKNGADNEDTSYFADMKSLCYRITEGAEIEDLFLIDEIKYQCPNPDIYYVTKRVFKEEKYSWEKGRVWFEQTRYEKDKNSEFKPTKTYEMYVDIFKK